MPKYNADTKVRFYVTTGYVGCGCEEVVTLGELGYEDFDDELIESCIEKDFQQWMWEQLDASWVVQDN